LKQHDVKVAAQRRNLKAKATRYGTMPTAYTDYFKSAEVIETNLDPDQLPVQFSAYAALNEDDEEKAQREVPFSLEYFLKQQKYGLCEWDGM
jgi:hypothetical protein